MTVIAQKPLGQLLLGRGYLQGSQLDRALDEQRQSSHQLLLGEILIDQEVCSEEQVAEVLAESDGIPFARIGPRLADPQIVGVLPFEFLQAHRVLPLFLVEHALTVAMAEPSNVFLVEEINRRTGYTVQVVAATAADIRATLEAYLHTEKAYVIDRISPAEGEGALRFLDQSTVAAPDVEPAVIKLVEYCLHGLAEGATEVHIEPGRELRIRFRMDGRLIEKLRPPLRLHAGLSDWLMHLVNLDPANPAAPQEGRLRFAIQGKTITAHLITATGHLGPRIVLRRVDEDRATLKLEKLGFSYDMLKQWRKLIAMPSGLVLVAGPTGSGRRATLYSALQERNTADANLCSVEDRIEHALPDVNQFQLNPQTGFTFSVALHAVLRQEPDVLMMSDLPDAETARLAAQTALDGRLVLAALHAADAPSALSRLLHLGVEPHLLGSTVTGVLARRLVRKLCPYCRVPYEPTSSERRQLERHTIVAATLYRPRGCERCNTLGYNGRIGIHELLIVDDALSDRLSQGISLPDLKEITRRSGLRTLRADGLEKAKSGLTTLDEVFRVTV